jgi:hypothetical protein
MVAATVLSIVIAGALHLSTTMSKANHEVNLWKAEDRNLGNLVERVIKQFNQQQISFQRVAVDEVDPKFTEELPLAWNDQVLVARDQCPLCPGRLGVVARPHAQFPGIFVVKMRISNPELFQGFREYKFLSVYK